MNVRVVALDPYNAVTGMLVPFVTQRMLEFSRKYTSEVNADKLVQDYLVGLYRRDPGVMLLAFVDEKGRPVGHCAANIESDGIARWVFVSQLKLDDNVGNARREGLALLDQWGRAHGATLMLMACPGTNEPKWAAKYGFRGKRLVLDRTIGEIPDELSSEKESK